MRDTEACQQAAKDLGRMRAIDVAIVRGLPSTKSGGWYSKRGENEWVLVSTLLIVGPIAVVQQGAFDVLDLSGLRIASFYERVDAERLALSLSPGIDTIFARAATGNTLAIRSLFRLCRIHKSAARRRGPTNKRWTKRELSELMTAERWGSRCGQVGANVSPERAKELLTIVGLQKCRSFPDDKLRHWYERLLARVEREGLPNEVL